MGRPRSLSHQLLPFALAGLLVGLPGGLSAQSDELLAARERFRELYEEGSYREAEPAAKKALALAEDEFGRDHPEVAIGLNDVATVYWTLNRWREAEESFARARKILEHAPAPYHVLAMGLFNNLTVLLDERGDWQVVEASYLRTLELIEHEFGRRSGLYARAYSNLGGFYKVQGDFQKAEEHYRKALEIKKEVFGDDHPSVAVTLANLANLFDTQGRAEEALGFQRQALGVRVAAYGESHPEVARGKDKLASLYRERGRFDRAATLYEEAWKIYQDTFEPDHPRVTGVLRNLASLHFDQARHLEQRGRAEEAADRYRRAEAGYKELLEIRRGSDPAYPQVPLALVDLANLYWHRGRYAEAEPLYREALSIQRAVLPEGHPEIALSINNLANLYYAQGRYGEALAHARRASAIHRDRASRFLGREIGILAEQKKNRHVFLLHVLTALGVIAEEPQRRDELIAEAFEAGQLAHATSTAAAVARMAARFAATGDELARLVSERQKAVDRWLEIDELLLEALTLPPEERDLKVLRSRAGELGRRIEELDRELLDRFPEYAEMIGQRPVTLADIQAELNGDEALVAFAVWDDRTFVWAVRRDRVETLYAMLGSRELGRKVGRLRRGVRAAGPGAELPEFDTTTAHELYTVLLEPLEEILAGAGHVFVVPDGPLTGLPLGLLVTAESAPPTAPGKYAEVPWLARRFAVTVLPAASSLTALRVFARKAPGSKAFLGVGDPLLDGEPGAGLGIALKQVFPRGEVDLDQLRGLSRLPETADELRQIGELLEVVPEEALFLGERASESTVRGLDLAEYRIVQFATHGLVAGELAGLPEPALVLTPPAQAGPEDDGLLYAGEIAQLDLHADWVVLSACNTAAGEAGGEGLSGLAKAFFYAGSRALLVSHWPVQSQAAARLTVGMFSELKAERGIGRAEALRRSMLALMSDDSTPEFAHPLYWAPFEVVGDGGRPPETATGPS